MITPNTLAFECWLDILCSPTLSITSKTGAVDAPMASGDRDDHDRVVAQPTDGYPLQTRLVAELPSNSNAPARLDYHAIAQQARAARAEYLASMAATVVHRIRRRMRAALPVPARRREKRRAADSCAPAG